MQPIPLQREKGNFGIYRGNGNLKRDTCDYKTHLITRTYEERYPVMRCVLLLRWIKVNWNPWSPILVEQLNGRQGAQKPRRNIWWDLEEDRWWGCYRLRQQSLSPLAQGRYRWPSHQSQWQVLQKPQRKEEEVKGKLNPYLKVFL